MKSFKWTLSIFTLLFIVSCAQEQSSVSNESGPIYKGKKKTNLQKKKQPKVTHKESLPMNKT